MPLRILAYELKIKNIKHLLYGKQYYIELDEGVEYLPVRKDKIDNTEFHRRYFGP